MRCMQNVVCEMPTGKIEIIFGLTSERVQSLCNGESPFQTEQSDCRTTQCWLKQFSEQFFLLRFDETISRCFTRETLESDTDSGWSELNSIFDWILECHVSRSIHWLAMCEHQSGLRNTGHLNAFRTWSIRKGIPGKLLCQHFATLRLFIFLAYNVTLVQPERIA